MQCGCNCGGFDRSRDDWLWTTFKAYGIPLLRILGESWSGPSQQLEDAVGIPRDWKGILVDKETGAIYYRA